MNICAEGSGENTNTARLASTPVLLLARVWPSASRLVRRSGGSRPRSFRVPTARIMRPAVAANAPPAIRAAAGTSCQ